MEIIGIILCTLAGIVVVIASQFIGRDRRVW
jgi:hypothetical protein